MKKKYIGPISKENFKAKVLVITNWASNIFVLLIFLFPITYLLFYTGILGSKTIPNVTLNESRMAICAILYDDRPNCTAFLVRENVLVTARHCVSYEYENNENVYLDFTLVKKTGYDNIEAQIAYYPESSDDDYAILITKSNLNIKPLEMVSPNDIENPEVYNPEVEIIGYPVSLNWSEAMNENDVEAGLFTGAQHLQKTQVSAYELTNGDLSLFQISNEIYGGNSGGPIIDIEMKKVIGICSSKVRDLGVEDEMALVLDYEVENVDALREVKGQSFCEKITQLLEDPNIDPDIWLGEMPN